MAALSLNHVAIDEQQANDNGPFPYTLVPSDPNASLDDLATVLSSQKDQLLEQLGKYGALLFRGFPVKEAEDFLKVLNTFEFEYGDYMGGGGPRSSVLGPIHNSTFTPADSIIPFHHELAYLTVYPTKLIFFCHTPPAAKGETPILLSNRLYQKAAAARPQFVKNLEEKRVVYTRQLADKSVCDGKFQRSWQQAFLTEDRAEAEARALKTGTASVTWLEDGAMQVVSEPLESIKTDPRNGQKTWFNSVVLLHPAAQDKAKNAPWQVTYGDGSAISDEDVLAVKKIMDEEAVAFKWEQGDWLIVDNMLAFHSRNSFTPPRLILAAIAN